MDSIKTNHIFFITDNNFIIPKENETTLIQKYFDVTKNRLFSFIIQNNELFLLLNQDTYGSAFFGNYVLKEPKYLIIKKFNPIFIFIQIIYNSQTEEEAKEKNKNLSSNEFIDTSSFIQRYEDKLKSLAEKSDLFNNDFDSIFKLSMKFVKYIFDQFSKNLALITEVKEISSDLDEDKKICVKKCESKLFNYLNSKVNLNPCENKEIENSKYNNENEKDILIKRKIYEKITVLEIFLPEDIYKKFLKYKHVDSLDDDEISNGSENNKNDNKRKTGKKKKKEKDEPARSKNQKTILEAFKTK